MRKKNGFTLTELLVVIAMIAVVGTIIIVNTIAINNRAKDSEYDRMVENIINSTKTYVSLYPDQFAELYSSKAFVYVSLSGVVKAGLLDEDTINPYTKEKLDLDDIYMGYVKAYVDGDSKEIVYKYPLTEDDYNNQIWLQMSTINSSEDETKGFIPINAFDGITPNTKLASIDFGFSDEKGNLINADDPVKDKDYSSLLEKYRKEYNITFEMPSSFKVCDSTRTECTSQDWYTNMPNGALLSDYYVPEKTGTFEIKYNWSYKVGDQTIYRTDTRIVRVTSQTEREKNKISSAATTTSAETTTANPDGIVYQKDNVTFEGYEGLNTGVALLKEDNNGNLKPFTVYIQGTVDSTLQSNKVVRILDFISTTDGSGFKLQYTKNTNYFRLIGYKNTNNQRFDKAGSYADSPFKYVEGKRFRMIIYFDPEISTNYIYYEYVADIDDDSFVNDKTLSNGTGGYEKGNSGFLNPVSSEQTLYVGGSKSKTEVFKGSMEKIIIFNKADPNLIYRNF